MNYPSRLDRIILLELSLRHKVHVGLAFFDVDYVPDAILVHIKELIPGPVDLFGLDQLGVWQNLVLSTELKALLGRGNTSYH